MTRVDRTEFKAVFKEAAKIIIARDRSRAAARARADRAPEEALEPGMWPERVPIVWRPAGPDLDAEEMGAAALQPPTWRGDRLEISVSVGPGRAGQEVLLVLSCFRKGTEEPGLVAIPGKVVGETAVISMTRTAVTRSSFDLEAGALPVRLEMTAAEAVAAPVRTLKAFLATLPTAWDTLPAAAMGQPAGPSDEDAARLWFNSGGLDVTLWQLDGVWQADVETPRKELQGAIIACAFQTAPEEEPQLLFLPLRPKESTGTFVGTLCLSKAARAPRFQVREQAVAPEELAESLLPALRKSLSATNAAGRDAWRAFASRQEKRLEAPVLDALERALGG